MTARVPQGSESASILALRLKEAEEMLRAIRHGEVDALVVDGPDGNRVYTLRGAEEPYRTLVEQMQEGAVVLSVNGDILYANAGFAALVGDPLEGIVGGRFDRFVFASDRRDVDELFSQGSGRCRTRLTRSGGSIEVSLSLTTTRSPAGDRRILVVTDLTDLLEARSNRDLAQRENRTKDEFLATFAHELRTPLSTISAAAQLLQLTASNEAPRSGRPYEVIVRQVNHITHLIDDLLDVERVVSGKIRLNRHPIDIADAIRQLVAAMVHDVAALDRQITFSGQPVWVQWDAVRLQQVVTNLLTNAVKYTPAGGQIRVAVRAEGDEAVLSVEDTGFGIAPTLLPGIFDMFVQVDRTLGQSKEGLGIGLALVRRLVELHGGTVAASSDGEGRGSTFTVRLARIPAPHDSSGHAVEGERRSRSRRVLVIEDSGEARQRLRMMFELAGHVVYDAPDLDRGLELVKAVRPEVGIIAMSSRIADRRLVARRLREAPEGRMMVLVAVGPLASSDGANSPMEDGFDFHFAQPVDAQHLARLLGNGALHAQSAQQAQH